MKPKAKRIIAREGLILISIILLAAVSYSLHVWLMNQETLYESNVKEIQPICHRPYDPLNILTNAGKILRFPKNTKDEVIQQVIKRDFPNIKVDDYIIFDSPEGRNIDASYNDKGQRVFNSIIYKIDFSYVFIFFIFFAYPLYWTIRFIIWAIWTLREKEEV